jgi:hypothetical protein
MASANVDKSAEHDEGSAARHGTGGGSSGVRSPSGPTPAGEVAATLPLGEAIAAWRRRQAVSETESTPPAGTPTTGADQRSPDRPAAGPVAPRRGRPRRVPQQDEAYQVIQAYIADFARELNDRAPLRASTTRAYNLYRRSGLDQGTFVGQLYAARAIVKERLASIRSRGADSPAGFPIKHQAGYYFAVLEDLLGLRGEGERPAAGPGAADVPLPSPIPRRPEAAAVEPVTTPRSGRSKHRR